MLEEIDVEIGVEQPLTLIHLHHKAIGILPSVLSFLLLNTEYKIIYPPNFYSI